MIENQLVQVGFLVEADLKERFEKRAAEEERSMSSALRLLMKQYLGENDVDPAAK